MLVKKTSKKQLTLADMSLEDIRNKMEKLGVKEKDIVEAVRWARKKKR